MMELDTNNRYHIQEARVMKLVKRLFLTFVICFVVAGVAAPLQSEAASIKLNKTKIILSNLLVKL